MILIVGVFLIFGFYGIARAQNVEPTPAVGSVASAPTSTDVVPEDPRKKMILLPLLYYTPETKFAAGAFFVKNFWKEKEGHSSHLIGAVSLSMNNQVIVSLAPKLYFDQGDWDVNGGLFYSYNPSKYYGRSVLTAAPSFESYVENTFLVSAGLGKNIFSHFFIRGGIAQDSRKISDYEAGGLIAGEVTNLAQSIEVQSAIATFEWDERDYPQAPRQGSWYRISHTFFSPRDREGYRELARFRKSDFDLRQYFLFKEKFTGALQFQMAEMQGDQIPFQYLNGIGGGSRMRGYYNGQYRDKSISLAQAEFRYDFKPNWVGTLFSGVARLGPRLQELEAADSFYSSGFGVHYILDPENRTKLRLDLGFTGKETGFYFLIGEAF